MRSFVVLAFFCSTLAAQTCAVGVSVPDSASAVGTCNVFPFGQVSFTYAGKIAAGFLDPVNPYVNDIAFAPCGTGTYNCNTVVIAMGHVPNPMPVPFNFPTVDASGVLVTSGSFLDLTIIHNSFATGTAGPASTSGPLSWNVTQNTWSPMGFGASSGTGFLWNGVDDVAFFITHQNSTASWGGACHRATEPRFYSTGYNQPACATCAAASALKIQLLVTQGPGLPAVPGWQCNQASSSLDINGAADPGPGGPMVTSVGTGTTVTANFGGLIGFPYEIATTSPEPGGGVGFGGFLTPGGQAVNINLTAPSIQYLFGLALANAFTPFTYPTSSSAPFSISAQQLVMDPSFADGFALSHLNELNFVSCGVTENFDTLSAGLGVAPIGWINPSAGAAWSVHTGSTTSGATGPTSAFNGSNYIYCETSSPNFPNVTFTMDTCPVDATTIALGALSFELSAIGVTIGTLNVYQGDGAGNFIPIPIFTQTGPEPGQAQGGTEWTNKLVLLSLVSPFVDFRFEYTSSTSFTGDLAIDDIMLN
ncbi:MAG: hypothetical protein HRU14_03880 [Planctomycetes bacterium]|nr:hypothetical protein [Planctomycetota bacterium]